MCFFHIPLLVPSISASFWGEKNNFGGKQCAHARKPRYFLSSKKSRNIANSPLAQNSTAHAGVKLRHGFTQLMAQICGASSPHFPMKKLVLRML